MKEDFLKKTKRISLDFIYNILASIILTGTMQILVYPFLAQCFSSSEYGQLVTIMGVVNTITVALGTSLNNTRLLMDTTYKEKKYEGDFNLILLLACLISGVLLYVISLQYFHYLKRDSLLISLISILMVFRSYITVEYRLILNFKKILWCNVFGAIGYVVGIIILMMGASSWTIPFLCSELVSLVFILKSTHIYKEMLERTPLFSKTVLKYLIIIVSVASSSVMTYFDRFFLYPTVGGEAVSIYTVASFFGKTLSVVMLPISSVLLGYYSQKGYKMDNKKFRIMNLITILISLVFWMGAVIVGPFITKLLYPTLIESAREFIPLANAAAVISVACNMIHPSVLRFAPTYFQIVKEILYAIVYFSLSMGLSSKYGIIGFCIAAVVSNLFKYIVIYLLGEITFKEKK